MDWAKAIRSPRDAFQTCQRHYLIATRDGIRYELQTSPERRLRIMLASDEKWDGQSAVLDRFSGGTTKHLQARAEQWSFQAWRARQITHTRREATRLENAAARRLEHLDRLVDLEDPKNASDDDGEPSAALGTGPFV